MEHNNNGYLCIFQEEYVPGPLVSLVSIEVVYIVVYSFTTKNEPVLREMLWENYLNC